MNLNFDMDMIFATIKNIFYKVLLYPFKLWFGLPDIVRNVFIGFVFFIGLILLILAIKYRKDYTRRRF